MTALVTAPVQPWRFFDVSVARVTRLSPSFVRLTLVGNDLDAFAANGRDQRFKVVLPDALGGYGELPRHPEWYAASRQLPPDRRNPVRTYTVRAVRAQLREVDVDMVLHGDAGPASRFAARARAGDRLVVLGPDVGYDGDHGGVEFRPPARHLGPTLLVGDPTAVPAVLAIVESLPADAFGEAVLEVPEAEDLACLADTKAPIGLRMTWVVRQGAASGLQDAALAALGRLGAGMGDAGVTQGAGPEPEAGQDDAEPFWEVPQAADTEGLYAWIAGESSLVTGLRRRLVRDLGVDRRAVAFMGYWRAGRAAGS